MTSNTEGSLRIVVGVDGSEQSKDALRWAVRMATLAPEGQTPLIQAVIVWDYPAPYGFGGPAPARNVDEAAGRVVEMALKETFGDEVPPNVVPLVRSGGAARVLIEMSEGAMATVVGSRGHGGFTGQLLGAVSAKVAEHAHSPVLVVHGEKDTTPGPLS